jgi:hypothetical protein
MKGSKESHQDTKSPRRQAFFVQKNAPLFNDAFS